MRHSPFKGQLALTRQLHLPVLLSGSFSSLLCPSIVDFILGMQLSFSVFVADFVQRMVDLENSVDQFEKFLA